MSLLFPPVDDSYAVGTAHTQLCKSAADAPVASAVLTGRFYVSKSGWGLLSVPNDLARGMFEAMQEPGIELPPGSGDPPGPFNAHISVMRKEDVDACGGPDKIKERGEVFRYQLGPIKSVVPMGWDGMSRVWFVEVQSPELKALRKSYGLPPLPMKGDNELQFHISIAVRRKHVLKDNELSKAAMNDWYANGGQEVNPFESQEEEQPFHGKTIFACGCEHRCRCMGPHGPDRYEEEPCPDCKEKTAAMLPMLKTAVAIDRLKEIKDHSDKKRYGHKQHLLRQEMQASPGEWKVEPGGSLSGVVHTPSGFRFHLPSHAVPKS